MTYQKPDLFLVGSAQGVVLGSDPLALDYPDFRNDGQGNHDSDPEVSRDTIG